ncbi:ribbon-helix-helix protein, CopG family [Streptomyces sp. NPDC057445]|uniref:ribbon-helix-helix protein, CopG family n=1 Tax=Streptomyces sp. NPDC057445 TaxID=3346136 RepID=UPI00367913AB
MPKSVNLEVDDQLYAQLQQRAAAEGTTVEHLIAEAARDAARDPRLEDATYRAAP